MPIVRSAGLAIVYKGKLLLGHPTGHKDDSMTIPKGKIDEGESKVEAARRETFEEVGIDVPIELIGAEGTEIKYRRSKKGVKNEGKVHKVVYWFRVDIDDLSQIGLEEEVIKENNLQLREIDWAKFVPSDEIESKIFWRFIPIAQEIGLI